MREAPDRLGVVVTGGASGIGQGIALMFAAIGARVVSVDIQSSAETIALSDGAVTEVQADVSDPLQVTRAFAAIDGSVERIDIACCAAGIAHVARFTDITPSDFDRVIGVNLRGTFLCGQQAARRMMASGGGRIINIASTASVQAWPHQSAYGASKGGVLLLTRCMAVDLAPHGVLVNAVAPGSISTPMADSARLNSQSYAHDIERTPLGRWGTAGEIAAAVRFIALDAEWMTGQTIIVDGGFLVNGATRLRATDQR